MTENSMSFDGLIDSITPEVYQNLKRAIEIGKWPDGRKLTRDQMEHTFQAIIAYEHQHIAEQDRVGFIDRGSKEEGEVCASTDDSLKDDPQPVQIK